MNVMLPGGPNEQLAEGRPGEVIAEASRIALRAARDASLSQELERARSKAVHAVIRSLGSSEACVRSTRVSGDLASPDAEYLRTLTGDSARVGDLMRRSVLGAFRTALALYELSAGGHLLVTRPSQPPVVAPPRASSIVEVIVCHANVSQAAITRTLLRVAMKHAPPLVTVESVRALREACREPKARLIVLDAELSGLDVGVIKDLRAIPNPPPTILLGSAAQLEVLRGTLPEDIEQLARPIERQGVTRALQALGVIAR